MKYNFSRKECAVGRYWVECSRMFSGHCKGNTTCNHVTGQCDGGCVVGWKGSLCNKGKFTDCFGFGVILSLWKKKLLETERRINGYLVLLIHVFFKTSDHKKSS